MSASTVAAAFEASARRFGHQPFLGVLPETAAAYGIEAGEISYAAALARIEALRSAYAAAGYRAGQRVGLLLDNRPAFFLHWFALNGLGLSVVPIHADLRAAELEYLVGHSEIVLAVALPPAHGRLRDAARAAGRTVALMADGDAPPPLKLAPTAVRTELVEVLAGASTGSARTGAELECALLYTSGTTGRPKGCILSNEYFTHAGRWYAEVGGLAALHDGRERMLTPLPLTHMNAMACSTMAMVATGGCLFVLDRFHPGSWWQSVREARASVVHYLGVMPAMLMKAPASATDRDHAVRFGFGAGVDHRLHAAFEQRFGFPLLEGWAMTETGCGGVIFAGSEPRKVGSHCFGRESADVEVRIVGDDGREAPVDAPGELWVRRAGPDPRYGFFTAYLKDEAATAEAWDQGWFHTGDIVSRAADGMLHFIDRRKNVIRRSGENIAAVEVESVLMQHTAVKACAVAAAPDEVRGDEVLACIVTHAPLAAQARAGLAAELVAHALQRLSYFKAPGYVAFVDALPLTPSQKVARGELKTLARSLPGQAHCIDTRALKKRPDAA